MIREDVIEKIIYIVEKTALFKEIKRLLPTYAELKRIPTSQMPIACVDADMPSPIYERDSQQVSFKQQIEAKIICYTTVSSNEIPDYYNSLYLNEIWKQLTILQPKEIAPIVNIRYVSGDRGYISPYNITSLQLQCLYISNKENI